MGEGVDQIGLPTGEQATSGAWHRLAPVTPRWPWITTGLLLQLIGAGAPVAYVVNKAHHEDIGGQISKATLTLAWRQAVHSHAGLDLMVVGALLFVVGSMLMARPFVRSMFTMFVAIPIAALAGVLLLGAAAILIALIAVGLDDLFDIGGGGGSGGGGGGGGGASSTIADTAVDLAPYSDGSSGSRRRRNREQPPDDEREG